jgi:hypothetical protein
MLAIALPAEDNWKHKPQLSTATAMNRAPHSSSSLTSPVSGRDGFHSHLSSTPMVAASSSNGTVVPSSNAAISNGAAYGSSSKPLERSKSRGGSVGGFVHGLVNNMQASLRGHKTAQSGTPSFSRSVFIYISLNPPQPPPQFTNCICQREIIVPANGYHSDHPPTSKAGLFKSKSSSVSPTSVESPESPVPSEKSRDQPPVKAFNKQLARSQSKSRAYESEGDNHTIGSIRHSRPGFPPKSTTSEGVPKANGHTHVPSSPLSRENSQTRPISVITNALARQNEPSTLSQSPSPSTPSQVPSYSLSGPVSRSAARAILELDAIPPADLLKTLATLLEQIAAANDALRAERTARGEEPWEDQLGAPPGQEADFFPDSPMPMPPGGPSSLQSSPTSSRSRSQLRTSSDPSGPTNAPIWNQLTTASRVALASRTATLSFHARHIPQISLEAYLLRILKYCPTANATFVAVLVYFDRMCRMAGNVENERHAVLQALGNANGNSPEDENAAASSEKQDSGNFKRRPPFAIDSYNVHRLVIAGVTVASKFFSDIFYTNSRYAKVWNPF